MRGAAKPARSWFAVGMLALAALAVVAGAQPVAAHEPGESAEASELVRQAIALIVSTPQDTEAIEDRVADAQEVEDKEGVDVALVRRAGDAYEAGDLHEARTLLERSIGARPHLGGSDVATIGEVSEDNTARGAEAGEAPILDPLDTGGIDGGDAVAIAVGTGLVLAGVVLAVLWRPSGVKGV